MAHAGKTKIWAKIISNRAPNAANKPKNRNIPPNLRRSHYGNSSWSENKGRLPKAKEIAETDEGDGSGPAQLEGSPSSYTRNDQI